MNKSALIKSGLATLAIAAVLIVMAVMVPKKLALAVVIVVPLVMFFLLIFSGFYICFADKK